MDDELYHLAMGALRTHLDEARVPFDEEDGDLVVNGQRLSLSVHFSGFTREGEQTIAPLDIQLHWNGDSGDRFRVGTLGVGADRLQAMRSAVQEWHLLAAAPVLAALGAELSGRRRSATRSLGDWELFAGRVGVRGTMPVDLHPNSTFYRSLHEALSSQARAWPTPSRFTLRSMFVMAASQEGTCEVQAAVDGYLSEELTSAIGKLPWPKESDAYLFKQLFVLRAGQL